METLSTPVSSIKALPLFPAATPNHQLRPSTNPSSLPIPAFTNLSARARARAQSHHHQAKSNSTPKSPNSNGDALHSRPQSVLRLSPSPPRHRPTPLGTPRRVHRAASTGYAAALLDVARCEGALAARSGTSGGSCGGSARCWRTRAGRGSQGGGADGGGGGRLREGGGFYRHVWRCADAGGKGRVGLVEEVMEQFVQLCDELSGTRVVVVMSEEGKKMEEQRLRGIAQEVHKATGAPKVRVRHLHRFAV
ncbi:hypothetical protein C4D60_Mb01t13140 [Musa balbisiana]|uniref:Uncharacterized protein n=1 Tax=Musa balbisiana TaxID=52838 RepID=A0A4S8JLW1_MUSBA|nr:hypothetical protein C4D60_Mb01t13140 [Musa balbisiana]